MEKFIFYFVKNRKFRRNYHSISGCLLGVGNPLLDYLVYVDQTTNDKIMKKFKLKKNSANIANSEQKKIFNFISKSSQEIGCPVITAGGSVQNSIRVAQWLFKNTGSTAFIGAVGSDKEATVLREKLNKCNVEICYQVINECDTGKCAIIVSGSERTLVTDFGASLHLTTHILDDFKVKQKFDAADYLYLEGFLWITNPQIMTNFVRVASNKIIVTNINSPYLAPYFIQSEHNFLQYVDILFGNQYEALALAKALGEFSHLKSDRDKFNEFLNLPVISTDALVRIALLLGQCSHNKSNVQRIIVFTQANKEVILCINGDEIHMIPVPKVPIANIVDSTGCGDAFAGGFLAEMIKGKSPLEAAIIGVKMSQYMLTQNGCNIYPTTIIA